MEGSRVLARAVATTWRAVPSPMSAMQARSLRFSRQLHRTVVVPSRSSLRRMPRPASSRASSSCVRPSSPVQTSRTVAPAGMAAAMLAAKSSMWAGCDQAGATASRNMSALDAKRPATPKPARAKAGVHHSRPWKPTAANDSTCPAEAAEAPAARKRASRSVLVRMGHPERAELLRLEHVVREEKLAVHRHHHDLHFVREPLGDDLLDQQRIVLQHH